MKKSDMLLESIGEIDDKFIEESEIVKKAVPWIQLVAAAACICLVVSAIAIIPHNPALKREEEFAGNTSNNVNDNLTSDTPYFDEPSSSDLSDDEADSTVIAGESSDDAGASTDGSIVTTPIESCENIIIAKISSINRNTETAEYNVSVLNVIRSEDESDGNITVYNYADNEEFIVGKSYLFSMNNSYRITDTFTSLVENDFITPIYPTSKKVLHGIDTITEFKQKYKSENAE